MIFIWNRKDVYNGFSIDEFNRIKGILSAKGIEYDFERLIEPHHQDLIVLVEE